MKSYFCELQDERALPGECYMYTLPWSRSQIGISLHLWSVFPGSLLAITQFVPAIRTRYPQVHRVFGYACWACGLIAAGSILLFFDISMGGALSTRVSTLGLAAFVFIGHYKAYRAIKAYRLDKHREWMLRTWIYTGGSILIMRPVLGIMVFALPYLPTFGNVAPQYWTTMQLPCKQVLWALTHNNRLLRSPQNPDFFSVYGAVCAPGSTRARSVTPSAPNAFGSSPLGGYDSLLADSKATVSADITSKRADFFMAALNIGFGPSFLIGILISVISVELYLLKTQEEGAGLRKLGELKKKARQEKNRVANAVTASDVKRSTDHDEGKPLRSERVGQQIQKIKDLDEDLNTGTCWLNEAGNVIDGSYIR